MGSDFENWLCDTVDTVGWAVLSVAPRTDSDDPEEWFSYSIGLTKTFGWPELICFGLTTETRRHMINDAVEECRRKELAPEAGFRLSEVLNGYDTLLAEGSSIPDSYFGSAEWFAKQSDVDLPIKRLQLLWPDADGYFPDDNRCAEDVRFEQTPLEKS
ncbi:DUF4262 domain-containing protein [Sphingopyxis sp.]|uniref:DUF4262 domain-containing protein n=1 Tax=Sphingopyxis sp. TaxID=1908224 RepID=UPI003D13E0B1